MINYAFAETPTPGERWRGMSAEERLAAVNISFCQIDVVNAKADGQVIVSLWDPLPARERGTVLLDYEEAIKQAVDPALTVWLSSMGDKNSLRKLRGIEVKQL